MPAVRDALDRRWTVRRVWWPFGQMFFNPDWPDWLFTIGLLITTPFVLAWPFWLLTRLLGAPWTLVVRCQGPDPGSGWPISSPMPAGRAAPKQSPEPSSIDPPAEIPGMSLRRTVGPSR